jgi:hypothetical protein
VENILIYLIQKKSTGRSANGPGTNADNIAAHYGGRQCANRSVGGILVITLS